MRWKKEITEGTVKTAILAERERCAQLCDAVRREALKDGMVAHADSAGKIAEHIRKGMK